jgi:hypothetical protein
MLHARGENNDDFLGSGALALVDQDAASGRKGKSFDEPVLETRFGEDEDVDPAKDSGNESAETSDSEDKSDNIKEFQNALVGMNVSQPIKILEFGWFHSIFDAPRSSVLYNVPVNRLINRSSRGKLRALIY